MKKKKSKYLKKKAICLGLTMAMTMNGLSAMDGTFQWCMVAKAANTSVAFDTSKVVTVVATPSEKTPGIPDGKLLSELERLVNLSMERDTNHEITFQELMDYQGEIDLSNIGSEITSISGLGYARSATSINLQNLTITEIPDYEFDGCKKLTSITLPDTVTKIGKDAFRGCVALETLPLSEHITEIGSEAFQKCDEISDVTIPSSVTSIGNNAFASCEKLKTVTLQNGKVTLGAGLFSGCTVLSEVTLPQDLAEIPAGCFQDCRALKEISVPSSVKSIGNGAFQKTALLEIDLSACNQLTKICEHAFAASTLKSFKLPTGLQKIERSAFEATSLQKIELPSQMIGTGESDSENGIGPMAFKDCIYLESVSLPKGITNLQESLFEGCIALSAVTIESAGESDLEKIEKDAFAGCASLNDTKFLSELKKLKEIGDGAFAYKEISGATIGTSVLGPTFYAPNANISSANHGTGLKEVVIPDSVTILGEKVFENQFNIRTASLGDGITEIPDNFFYYCAKLYSVKLPKQLKKIGKYAFYATSLNDITFPDTLEEIDENAFRGASFTRDIKTSDGQNVTYETFYVNPDNVVTATTACEDGYGIVEYLVYNENTKKVEQLYVKEPKTLPDGYYTKASTTNNTKKMNRVARKHYIRLNDVDFSNQNLGDKYIYYEYDSQIGITEMQNVVVRENADDNRFKPDNMEGYAAVYIVGKTQDNNPIYLRAYLGLREVNIPDSVTKIGDYAFYNCYNLTKCKLPGNLENIGEGTFGLRDMNLLYAHDIASEKNDTSSFQIPERAFVLPEKLKSIGDKAFENNANISMDGTKLPESLETIGDSAFKNCRGLRAFTCPLALKHIGTQAFWGCSDYTKIEDIPYDLYTMEKNVGLLNIDFTKAIALKEVGEGAFALTPVTTVVFPEGVTRISKNMFQHCGYLKTVVCSKKTERIEDFVFGECSSLASLTISADTRISYKAFAGRTTNKAIAFVVNDPKSVSLSLGEKEIIKTNVFPKKQIRGDFKVTESAGETGFINILSNTTQTVDGTEYLCAQVEGKQVGQTKIGLSGVLKFYAYSDSQDEVNTYSVEVKVPIQVAKKKCEGIEENETEKVVAVSDKETGIELAPNLLPQDCTELREWENANDEIVKIETQEELVDGEKMTGSKAKVYPKALGTSSVVFRCGMHDVNYQIHVVVPAKSVTLNQNALDLRVEDGKQVKLMAAMDYDQNTYNAQQWKDYGDIVQFYSENEKIATVNSEGLVTAVNPGKTTIVAKALGGKKEARCQIEVKADQTYVKFVDSEGKTCDYKKNPLNVNCKDEFTLRFVTDPVDSTTKLMSSFDASDAMKFIKEEKEKVATENGEVEKVVSMTFQALKPGRHTVTICPVQYKDKETASAVCDVDVIAHVTDFAFRSVEDVKVGETVQLFGTLTSTFDSTQDVTKIKDITSDEVQFSVKGGDATIHPQTGSFCANEEGTFTVRFVANGPNGTVLEKEKTIQVTRPVATSVRLFIQNDASNTLVLGNTLQLGCKFVPEGATDRVTYESLNPEILKVNADGLVTGLQVGTGKIKVQTEGRRVTDEITIAVVSAGGTSNPSRTSNPSGTSNP
ncbi:MAG: leucine-rich repeat protein, partial [Lachnospiraceae bacterium]|nr:leucine-rich repeat protein [Lachnospiraceae bacterium]